MRLESIEFFVLHLGMTPAAIAPTFLLRVERRMHVTNVPSLQVFIERLKSDHDEALALFRDLLIRVTSFFRDKETIEVLESTIIPQHSRARMPKPRYGCGCQDARRARKPIRWPWSWTGT